MTLLFTFVLVFKLLSMVVFKLKDLAFRFNVCERLFVFKFLLKLRNSATGITVAPQGKN